MNTVNGRDLERIMRAMGATHSGVDTVSRKLRQVSRLPLGGRGFNAPRIGASEAAAFLATYAGADPASDAAAKIKELEKLSYVENGPRRHLPFLKALTAILESPAAADSVMEVRVGRNVERADIWFRDGRTERFDHGTTDQHGLAMLRAEGVLPGPFLKYVARVLSGEVEPPQYRSLNGLS